MITAACTESRLQISFLAWFIRFLFFPSCLLGVDDLFLLFFSVSLPPALHQPTPAILTPHTSVAALIQPQTTAGSIAKQIIQQQSISPSLPLPVSMHSSARRGSSEAEGPYWAGPGLSTIASLFIEASMGLYAAGARPCPQRHQSSSAPGLLSLPRQAANRSLPGSSIGKQSRGEKRRISLLLLLQVWGDGHLDGWCAFDDQNVQIWLMKVFSTMLERWQCLTGTAFYDTQKSQRWIQN